MNVISLKVQNPESVGMKPEERVIIVKRKNSDGKIIHRKITTRIQRRQIDQHKKKETSLTGSMEVSRLDTHGLPDFLKIACISDIKKVNQFFFIDPVNL